MFTTILALLTAFTLASEQSEDPTKFKVFSCRSKHSIFDPNFQQGSEIYLDLYFYPESKKVEATYIPAEGPKFNLFQEQENTKTLFDLKQSRGLILWGNQDWKSYVSMVYLGGPWGLATRVPKKYSKQKLAGTDFELWCDETKWTNLFFDQIGAQ